MNLADYKYSVRTPGHYDGVKWVGDTYKSVLLKVEVLHIGEKMARIKFREPHRDGRPAGTTTSVQLKSLIFPSTLPDEHKNLTSASGEAPRLPYKDN